MFDFLFRKLFRYLLASWELVRRSKVPCMQATGMFNDSNSDDYLRGVEKCLYIDLSYLVFDNKLT